MEALLFRSLSQDLRPLLLERRLERIFSPGPGCWTLRLQPRGHARFLLFAHRPSPCALMLAEHRPENPLTPAAQVMWLRKRIQGLRILAVHADWSNRRLDLGLGVHAPECWLILDCHAGVRLESQSLITGHQEPPWPSLAEIRNEETIWQSFPHISPLLRKSLAALTESEATTLHADLQRARQPFFYVYDSDRQSPFACPWRLPPLLRQGKRERRVESALEAAVIVGQNVFFPPGAPEHSLALATEKKRKRLIQRLEADEQRMLNYCRLAEQAQLLQAGLHLLPTHKRLQKVSVADFSGQPREILLDAKKTVLENMEHWFRLSGKGRRGLLHIQKRREEALSGHAFASPAGVSAPEASRASPTRRGTGFPGQGLPVHRFLSSDGFTILRGRNQKANHALLTRLASPFDYWFHAEMGPGAHVIIKRDSPGHMVPEQSMLEAAALAGLASHFSDAGQASVICAEIRHVRTVKGSPGLARVEKALRTMQVVLDPALEARLKQS